MVCVPYFCLCVGFGVVGNVGVLPVGIIGTVGVLAGVALLAKVAKVRGWDVRRAFSVLTRRRATGSGTTLARSGLAAGAGWRVMCAAARLMPRAAGRRWLAEAESFLAEAQPAQRRPAIRSYLITAPQVITVTWAGDLARRARGMKRAVR
jgi:hypothetical protein